MNYLSFLINYLIILNSLDFDCINKRKKKVKLKNKILITTFNIIIISSFI